MVYCLSLLKSNFCSQYISYNRLMKSRHQKRFIGKLFICNTKKRKPSDEITIKGRKKRSAVVLEDGIEGAMCSLD